MPREIKAPPAKVESSTSFDGKHTIEFNEGSHRYKLDGKPCAGVTTFLKGSLPTGQGLISWQKGQALEYLWAELTELNHDAVGYDVPARFLDADDKTRLFKEAKAADRTRMQEAADVGTILHSLAEMRSRGQIEQADKLLARAQTVDKWPLIESCYSKYLDWEKQNLGEFVESEALVASPAYAYCGKFDLLSRRDGKLVLSDYKTSSAIYTEQKIQLAAYKLAIKAWLGLDVAAIEILRFGKKGGEFETCLIDDPVELQLLDEQAIRCRQTFSFIQKFDKEK